MASGVAGGAGAGGVAASRGGSGSGATGGVMPSPAGGEGGRAEDGGESGADTAGSPNGGASAGTGETNGSAGAPNEAGAPGEGGAPSDPPCDGPGARFATDVVEHAFGTGQTFNQSAFPAPIFGPPEANQARSVVSLGNGGFVTLAFAGNAIVDGPGADFLVFENPLPSYVELATVAVSEDGVVWTEFPCTAPDEDTEVTDFGSCAGVRPVHASSSNGIDPLDPIAAGGDAFDLADVGVPRAKYVRITDRADLSSPTGGVFDLDAVGIVNAECP